MRTSIIFTATAFLVTGCTTTPSPTESVPTPNFQARLSDVAGNIEGSGGPVLGIGGSVSGEGCIYTQLGDAPAGTRVNLAKGECTAEIVGPVFSDAAIAP